MELDLTGNANLSSYTQAPLQDLLSSPALSASVSSDTSTVADAAHIGVKSFKNGGHRQVPFAALRASAHKVSDALFGR